VCSGIRKVAVALQRRRHGVLIRAVRSNVMQFVIGIEEEQLVAVSVKMTGNEERAADGAARILPAIERLCGRLTRNAVHCDGVPVIEPFVGVEFLVAIVVVSGSVKLAGTVLDD